MKIKTKKNNLLTKFFIASVIFIIFVGPLITFALVDTKKEEDILYTLEVPFAGKVVIDNIKDYILTIYSFSVGLGAVLAVVIIMYGGFRYAISAGNEQSVSSAKETITSALIGLVILLSSYMILNFINPELTKLDSLGIEEIAINLSDKGLYDLPPCSSGGDNRSTFFRDSDCPQTLCGEICQYNGEVCRGSVCAAGAYSSEDCDVSIEDCGCYPTASNAFGDAEGSYECQMSQCGQVISTKAIPSVKNYNDYEKRDDISQINTEVEDYICQKYNTFTQTTGKDVRYTDAVYFNGSQSNGSTELYNKYFTANNFDFSKINKNELWEDIKDYDIGENTTVEQFKENCSKCIKTSAGKTCNFETSCSVYGVLIMGTTLGNPYSFKIICAGSNIPNKTEYFKKMYSSFRYAYEFN